ncbi:MAG: EpsG family protein [Pseudoflavonifractor sp.]|nr:EpsG family protein [Alloprevotella sp.]MCM1116079.1 EpsG family protein [Pseudoflavonifractor sp.]
MIIILSLFAVCALFAYSIEKSGDDRQRRQLTFACLALMALVSGTRLVGGLDFPTYEGHYNNLPTFPDVLNPALRNNNYEIGYTYIASFFKTLGISFYGFCLIHSIFFYFCLYKGLKRYTSHFGIVIMVFLYKLFFYNTMISMRQSITVACFLLMVPLIQDKKYIKYYICALLVSTIHNGAYLLFLIYPLAYVALSKARIRWLNFIFIPTLFIGLAGIDVLGPLGQFLQDNAANANMASKSQKYFNNENASPIGIFHTLEYFLLMFVLYRNLRKINLRNDKVHTVMWMFLCLLPLFTLFRGSEILTREKDYFLIYYAVIIGWLIDRLPQYRKLIYTFVALLCAFGYYRYVMLFDGGAFLNYHSWLFDPEYSFFLN